ncbi:MAG: hypothetical protein IPN53_00850 [Comamonadaceae bacterium]|nr:hypothetical protein [Comamonadaceae bacterium]
MHDSRVALPLSIISAQRVNPRAVEKTEFAPAQAQAQAQAQRYNIRTGAERAAPV